MDSNVVHPIGFGKYNIAKTKVLRFVPYEIQSKDKKWPFTEVGYRLEEQEITRQRPKKRKRRARSKDGLDIRRE